MIDQLTSFLGTDVSYALGWTIIHSLWQVSLLALIMSVVHKVYQHKTSEFKYNVSLSGIILSLVCSTVTFIIYYMGVSSNTAAEAIVSSSFGNTTIIQSSVSILDAVNNAFTNNIQHINTIWIVGAILFSLRFVLSFGYIKYIKSTATVLKNPTVQNLLASTKSNIGFKKAVHILESAKINVPMVLGHAKPIILFPIGMINMLTTEEIEAIITHELFHIKRHDYIINMVLTVIEIVYFFHPAMWWISANIKAERENCCDDAALNYNIDSITYAKVLVKLQEIRNVGIPSLAMPFASNKHQLLNRIKRILNMEQTKNDIREKSVATVLLLFVAMLFASNVSSQLPKNKSINTVAAENEIILEIEDGKVSSFIVDGEQQDEEKVEEIQDVLNTSFPENLLEDGSSYSTKIFDKPTLTIENDKLFFQSEHEKSELPKSWLDLSDVKQMWSTRKYEELILDTLPNKFHFDDNEQITIITEKNGKEIEIERNKGKITKLKIDGKIIPESEYHLHQKDIDAATENLSFDFNGNMEIFGDGMKEFNRFFHKNGNLDSIISNSFGMIFDGNNWREFGGNIEQLLDNDVFEKMEDMENFRMFDLKELENMEGLKKLENLKELKGLEDLEHILEGMNIQLDSSMKMYNLNLDDLNGFEFFDGFDGFEFFNDNNIDIRDNEELFGSNTVVDKIGNALNRDGLLKEYKSNKIELSGKHLKINGEKMPKALFNKYKNIYQEATGAPLTKKSKMVFDVDGKPSKRKVRSF